MGQFTFDLGAFLNRPGCPAVAFAQADRTLSCNADTWEPVLRARIEDALDAVIGGLWPHVVGFV